MTKLARCPRWLLQSDTQLTSKYRSINHEEDIHISSRDPYWALDTSLKRVNEYRNRYTNILTYDRTRVKLNVVSGNDYINASYIKLNIDQGQTYGVHDKNSTGYYIATQGPTHRTWGQFWQMCYHECPQEDIVIVMVTPLVEGSREKCYKYWPSCEGEKRIIPKVQKSSPQPGDYSEFPYELEVECIGKRRYPDGYVLTELSLKSLVGEEAVQKGCKRVHHLYFDQWQDFGRPNKILPIANLSRHAHQLLGTSRENPIIVHCSAGVGRSGTFITLDYLMYFIFDRYGSAVRDESEDEDLVELTVRQLRSQRMKMVQMKDQFLFVYHSLMYLYYENPNTT